MSKASSKAKAVVQVDTGKSSGLLGRFTGLVDKAEKSLGRFGLTTRDLSVIMGAGLAGGVAAAGKALLDFGVASVQASARLEDARNLSERVFQESSASVEQFAETASTSLGLSERAALAAASQFGLFAKNVGLPTEAAANLSTSLTQLAGDIASAQPDFVDIEEVLIALRAALRGERDPLERFGVTLTDASIKAKAAELGIGGLKGELTSSQKVVAAYGDILDKTNLIQGDFAATSDSLPNSMNTFSAAVENLQASLGSVLEPTVIEVVQTLATLVEGLTAAKNAAAGLTDDIPKGLSEGYKRLTIGILSLGGSEVLRAIRGLGERSKDAKDSVDELASAEEIAAQSAEALTASEKKSTDALDDVAKARKRLTRAVEDSERAVDNAERQLSRAIEASGERIDDAERALADAFEERSERIADAERDLADQRLDNTRSIRDARERLADFDKDATDRELENQRTLAQARRERTKAILNATVALSSARRAEDAEAINAARLALREADDKTHINDAERQLAEDRKDRKEERQRLERELSETIVDAQAAEEEARRNLAQTIEDTNERVQDSERNLAEARRDGARQVEDAQRALNDAIREGKERVADAKDSLEEYAEKAGEAAVQTKRLKNELKDLDKIARDLADDFFDPGLQDAFAEVMGKQHGGPVLAGRPYIVGEAGPELMVPGRAGSVVTNDQLMAALSKMVAVNQTATAGPMVGQMTVMVPHQDPRVLANELAYRLVMGVRG